MTDEVKNMSDSDIVKFFYIYIRTDTEYIERDNTFLYATPHTEGIDYAEHSGSDILFMRFEIEKHLNEKRN